jgi:hypothetical protein
MVSLVRVAVTGACGGESESAVRIAPARLGEELRGFKVLKMFRGKAGSL